MSDTPGTDGVEATEVEATTDAPQVAEVEEDAANDDSFADQVARAEAQVKALLDALPKTEVEEPKEKEAPKEEPKPNEAPTDEVAALKARLEEATALLEAERTKHARETLVRDSGLPAEYASFISGDKDSWKGQVDMLLKLRGDSVEASAASVPRDPAVDADYTADDDKTNEARAFFGLD